MPLCIPALAFSLCLSVSLYPHSQWECSPRPRVNEGPHLYISLPKFCCPDIATFETTCTHVCTLSHSVVFDSATPWMAAHQAPLSMGFSGQGYWSRLPFPPPGDLPDPGIEPGSLLSPALVGGILTTSTIWEAHKCTNATCPPGVFLK